MKKIYYCPNEMCLNNEEYKEKGKCKHCGSIFSPAKIDDENELKEKLAKSTSLKTTKEISDMFLK